MKKYIMGAVAAMALAIIAVDLPVQAEIKAGDVTGGAIAPHVNIAIFHKVHGQESWKYPDHIAKGKILHVLDGKAQFILINHTAGLKDGDVIVIGSDVLRDDHGSFEDFGVDCQMVVHIKGKDVELGGICEVLMVDKNHREIEHQGIIKKFTMHPGADWQLIYNDVEDGIAVYADEKIGLE